MKTANDKRQEWLNTIKVGDEVAVDDGWYGKRSYAITKVTKITPTRRFQVERYSCTFDSSGREMGRSKGGWHSRTKTLEPVTFEIKDFLAREGAIQHLRGVKWETLSTEQLLSVLQIVSDAGSKDS